MSYGVEFTNTSGTVVLDSELARMCVIASGTLAANINSVNYFPVAVTTQEPPLVFVRLINPGNGLIGQIGGFVPLGTPGNWTGFVVGSSYVGSSQFAPGDWFACQFGGQQVAQFGMRLWDGAGKVLFDSGTPAARFTRFAQNWTYAKSIQSDTTYYNNYYTIDFAFDNTEFQLINQFGMKLISTDNVGRTIGSWWDWPSNRLWAVTGAFGNPYDFHLPALFAKRFVN